MDQAAPVKAAKKIARVSDRYAHRSAPIWRQWKMLLKCFSYFRLLGSLAHPFRRNWSSFDAVEPVRRSAAHIAARTVLTTTDAALVESLQELAVLNASRQAVFLRTIVLGYFTIPIGIAAIVAQVEPGAISTSIRAFPEIWTGVFCGATTAVIVRMLEDWRARDLAAAIELFLIERKATLLAPAAAPA